MTDIWGPPVWETLHYISFAYPIQPLSDDIRKYFAFYNSVIDVLPCPICRDHLRKHMKKHPIEYALQAGREGLIRWVIDVHNEVNKSLEKPVMTYDEVIDLYTQKMKLNAPIAVITPDPTDPIKSNHLFDILLIGSILVIAGIMLYRSAI